MTKIGTATYTSISINHKPLIFQCDCGHPAFLTFEKDGCGLWVTLTDEPSDFWHWLKQWWYRKIYHAEVLLSPKQIRQLKQYLEEK